MLFFNIIQGMGVVVSIGAYMPQIARLFKTRSSRDLSLVSWLMWVFAFTCYEAYAINLVVHYQASWMYLVVNTLSLALEVFLAVLIIAFRRGAEEE